MKHFLFSLLLVCWFEFAGDELLGWSRVCSGFTGKCSHLWFQNLFPQVENSHSNWQSLVIDWILPCFYLLLYLCLLLALTNHPCFAFVCGAQRTRASARQSQAQASTSCWPDSSKDLLHIYSFFFPHDTWWVPDGYHREIFKGGWVFRKMKHL